MVIDKPKLINVTHTVRNAQDYCEIYKDIPKINSIVTRSLIAPGPDHAEGANDASRAAGLHLFIGNT